MKLINKIKTHRCAIGIVALLLLFVGSMATSVFLFHFGYKHFRMHNSVRLDPFELSRYPAEVPPVKTGKKRAVFYGDSRALAWAPPSKPSNVEYINRGIGFQSTAQILARFDAHIAPLKPELVIVQAGINDLKTIPLFPERKEAIVATVKKNIKRIVEKSRSIGAKVILTTVFPTGDVPLYHLPFWSDAVPQAVVEVNSYLLTLQNENVRIFETSPILADGDGVCKSQYQYDLLHLVPAGYNALNQDLQKLVSSQLLREK